MKTRGAKRDYSHDTGDGTTTTTCCNEEDILKTGERFRTAIDLFFRSIATWRYLHSATTASFETYSRLCSLALTKEVFVVKKQIVEKPTLDFLSFSLERTLIEKTEGSSAT